MKYPQILMALAMGLFLSVASANSRKITCKDVKLERKIFFDCKTPEVHGDAFDQCQEQLTDLGLIPEIEITSNKDGQGDTARFTFSENMIFAAPCSVQTLGSQPEITCKVGNIEIAYLTNSYANEVYDIQVYYNDWNLPVGSANYQKGTGTCQLTP